MIPERGLLGTAVFSDCYSYRYTLDRHLPFCGDDIGRIAFLMLNPSTATSDNNDPTVAKCCTYASAAGGTFLTVVNIFAFRSTDPDVLKTVDDPIGPENDSYILNVVSQSTMTICAWGKHGRILKRGAQVVQRLIDNGLSERLYSLHLNGDGSPGHPLYLPLKNTPQKWISAADYVQSENKKTSRGRRKDPRQGSLLGT